MNIYSKIDRAMRRLSGRAAYKAATMLGGRAGFPLTIYLSITNKCNLKCSMCDLSGSSQSLYGRRLSPANNDLTVQTWMDFIDQVYLDKPAIELCAAEPLLYKDLKELVRHIKGKGLTCRIFTNGYLLDKFSDFFCEVGVDHIFVSIDGAGEIHDEIRGLPGLYDRVISNIKTFQKKDRCSARPRIDINYTISDKNYSHIKNTFYDIAGKNVEYDRFTIVNTLFATTAMVAKHNERYPEYKADAICETGVDFRAIDTNMAKEQIKELIKGHPDKVRVYPEFDIEFIDDWYKEHDRFVGNRKCMFIWNSASVTSDGCVVPNLRCVDRQFGNIQTEKFTTIWNSPEFRKFRILTKKESPFTICARCSASFMR